MSFICSKFESCLYAARPWFGECLEGFLESSGFGDTVFEMRLVRDGIIARPYVLSEVLILIFRFVILILNAQSIAGTLENPRTQVQRTHA